MYKTVLTADRVLSITRSFLKDKKMIHSCSINKLYFYQHGRSMLGMAVLHRILRSPSFVGIYLYQDNLFMLPSNFKILPFLTTMRHDFCILYFYSLHI